jgi:hypothetical protein
MPRKATAPAVVDAGPVTDEELAELERLDRESPEEAQARADAQHQAADAARAARAAAENPMRHEGDPGDAPTTPILRKKRIRITSLDGRVDEIVIDPDTTWLPGANGAFLTIERTEPTAATPWTGEQVVSRFGIFGIAKIEIEDPD